MAASISALELLQEFSFTSGTDPPTVAAATALSKLSEGRDLPTGHSSLGSQFIWVTATHSAGAGTGTLVFFLADDDSVGSLGAGKMFQDTATLAATTTRQSHSTAAGDYVCTVTFAISNKNTLDLMRFQNKWPKWYCGCTAISSGTITVRVFAGRAI